MRTVDRGSPTRSDHCDWFHRQCRKTPVQRLSSPTRIVTIRRLTAISITPNARTGSVDRDTSAHPPFRRGSSDSRPVRPGGLRTVVPVDTDAMTAVRCRPRTTRGGEPAVVPTSGHPACWCSRAEPRGAVNRRWLYGDDMAVDGVIRETRSLVITNIEGFRTTASAEPQPDEGDERKFPRCLARASLSRTRRTTCGRPRCRRFSECWNQRASTARIRWSDSTSFRAWRRSTRLRQRAR